MLAQTLATAVQQVCVSQLFNQLVTVAMFDKEELLENPLLRLAESRRERRLCNKINHPATWICESRCSDFFRCWLSCYLRVVTMVPTASPCAARRTLPRPVTSNTMTGILFSLQSVTAVASITCRGWSFIKQGHDWARICLQVRLDVMKHVFDRIIFQNVSKLAGRTNLLAYFRHEVCRKLFGSPNLNINLRMQAKWM